LECPSLSLILIKSNLILFTLIPTVSQEFSTGRKHSINI
jgi:hypothetical protein